MLIGKEAGPWWADFLKTMKQAWQNSTIPGITEAEFYVLQWLHFTSRVTLGRLSYMRVQVPTTTTPRSARKSRRRPRSSVEGQGGFDGSEQHQVLLRTSQSGVTTCEMA